MPGMGVYTGMCLSAVDWRGEGRDGRGAYPTHKLGGVVCAVVPRVVPAFVLDVRYTFGR